jgi:hypothetical protein
MRLTGHIFPILSTVILGRWASARIAAPLTRVVVDTAAVLPSAYVPRSGGGGPHGARCHLHYQPSSSAGGTPPPAASSSSPPPAPKSPTACSNPRCKSTTWAWPPRRPPRRALHLLLSHPARPCRRPPPRTLGEYDEWFCLIKRVLHLWTGYIEPMCFKSIIHDMNDYLFWFMAPLCCF